MRGGWRRASPPVFAGLAAALVWGHAAVARGDVWAQVGLMAACAAVLATSFYAPKTPAAPRELAAAVAAVVLAASLVNLWFLHYAAATAYDLDAFRPALRTRQWPLYGHRARNAWPGAFAAMAAAALLGGFAATVRRATPWRIAALCGLMLLACFGYALSDPVGRAGAIFVADRRFVADAAVFQTDEWALKDYVGWMRGLSSFGQHYPPGNMLVLGYGGVFGRNLMVAFVASSPAWTYLAGRAWGLSRRASWYAALLLACGGYLLSESTISVTSEVPPLATVGLWLAGRSVGVRGRPSRWAPLALGGLCWAWAFVSFSVTTWLLCLSLTLGLLVVQRRVHWRRLLYPAVAASACFAAITFGFDTLTGFDLLACFREAMLRHHLQIGGHLLPPAEPWGRYLLRGLGDGLAPLLAWLPTSALALLALRRRRGIASSLVAGVLATAAVAAFSGSFILETERIWLFLLPSLALAGGQVLALARRRDGRAVMWVLLAVVLAGLLVELRFQHYE